MRVHLTDTVQCLSAGGVVYGHCVNLSRSGMQIVVNRGQSHDSIRSIAFSLPNSRQTLDIPCRLARAGGSPETGREHVLGVEFSPNAEAQLLLIDRYVRDAAGGGTPDGGELRRLPRAACSIEPVEIDREAVRVISIENISLEGLLIHFVGPLSGGDAVTLTFCLPGDRRPLSVSGVVTYIIENAIEEVAVAGIRLEVRGAVDSRRIANFITSTAVGGSLKDLHRSIAAELPDPRYCIEDPEQLQSILESLRCRNGTLNLLFEHGTLLAELTIDRLEADNGRMLLEGELELPGETGLGALTAYCSFYLCGCSYYFRTAFLGRVADRAALSIPTVMFQSEKRSHQRKVMELDCQVDLELDERSGDSGSISARLVDISRRGFLCEVPEPEPGRTLPREGQQVRFCAPEELGLERHGIVRHVKNALDSRGRAVLQVGVETGVRRREVPFVRFTAEQWSGPGPFASCGSLPTRGAARSIPVRYRNRKGQEIVALVNATCPGERAPVVLLPPAYGKTKEALAALAATLIATFEHYGRPLVTVRFDGIDRPGESFNQDRRHRRGYEMLHYHLIQGLEDLRTTLDWAEGNPFFVPEQVFLVSCSLAAMDARKLLASPDGERVAAWVSCMGVPSARSAYGNLLGGMDIIGNHKIGIPNGMGGVLGYLLDLDRLAGELVSYRYAHLTDARLDMARVRKPVLWIYGSHDRWLVSEEIHDIMGVCPDAGPSSSRSIVEIPTGHNLRISEDAIKTFKIIAAYLYAQAHGERVEPVDPDKEQVLRMITHERERLGSRQEMPLRHYWQGYLIGDEQGSRGYDFYANFAEFREFLARECELLAVRPGDRVADLGCGTGLFLETLLNGLSREGISTRGLEILAVDLVEEALDSARGKCQRLIDHDPALRDLRIDFRQMDLSPNRLIPIEQFLSTPDLDYDFLRNKVMGLRNVTIDTLRRRDCEVVRRVMRGAPLDEATLSELSNVLHDGHRQAVLDFNRAARFLTRQLESSDLNERKRSEWDGPLPEAAYSNLSAVDLHLSTLDLAESTVDLHLPLPSESFSKVVASLFVSYLFNPQLIFPELFRILEPGGKLLVSALRPDSDMSEMYVRFIEAMNDREAAAGAQQSRESNIRGARAMLNEVAALMCLEEDGLFTFHNAEELLAMFGQAGFERLAVHHSLGEPPQAIIVTGIKP